jgi:cysteine desulfurase
MFFFRRKVYLDNNATTPVAAAVCRRMNEVLKETYGNPSSLYRAARDSAVVLEEARQTVALVINAEPGEILFTGSATEANNQVLVSLFEKFYPQKDTIVSSPIEHPAILETLGYLEKRGAKIKYCRVDNGGFIDPAEFDALIDSKTFLAVLMLANNETGSIQPVGRTAELCRTVFRPWARFRWTSRNWGWTMPPSPGTRYTGPRGRERFSPVAVAR